MMWNSPVTLSGIVVDSKNKGDTGKLIEIFTSDGPIKVYAYGARRLTSRYLPLTKLFSLVNIECTVGTGYYILKDGKQIAGLDNIERDTQRFFIAADVIRNTRIVLQNSDMANKLYALFHVFLRQLNDIGDYEHVRLAILTLTVKFYIYVLAYIGIDVLACARTRRYSDELIEICNYLKGKRVSEAMLDEVVFDTAQAAYGTLADIYMRELDIKIDKTIIL